MRTHTSYLSQSSHVRHVEKNLSCGEISDFYTWQMGRNLKNVAEFQISSHDRSGEFSDFSTSVMPNQLLKLQ